MWLVCIINRVHVARSAFPSVVHIVLHMAGSAIANSQHHTPNGGRRSVPSKPILFVRSFGFIFCFSRLPHLPNLKDKCTERDRSSDVFGWIRTCQRSMPRTMNCISREQAQSSEIICSEQVSDAISAMDAVTHNWHMDTTPDRRQWHFPERNYYFDILFGLSRLKVPTIFMENARSAVCTLHNIGFDFCCRRWRFFLFQTP